jgi:hypothetical protein
LSSDERNKILLDVADALEKNENLIRTENEADVAAAQDAGYEKFLVDRLTLKPGKVAPLYISAYILTATLLILCSLHFDLLDCSAFFLGVFIFI